MADPSSATAAEMSTPPMTMPVMVQPPSPQVESNSTSMTGTGYAPHQPAIPRKPMHRSISVPLNDRLGALRHPRPLRSPTISPDGSASPQIGHFPPEAQSEAHAQAIPSSPIRCQDASRTVSSFLRHAARSRDGSISSIPASPSSASSSSCSLLAHLILDALQLPISHLLHIIPPHLLDETHEVLSATSLAVPVTSVEAFMEAFRGINWLCDAFVEKQAQLQLSSDQGVQQPHALQQDQDEDRSGATPSAGPSSQRKFTTDSTMSDSSLAASLSDANAPRRPFFDVFELSQRAADVVSGQAATRGIEIILSLNGLVGDEGLLAGMQSMADGEEEAVRYALTHCLSRLIELTPPLSVVELALKIAPNTKGKNREGAFPCLFEIRVSVPNGDPKADDLDLDLFHPESTVLQFAQAQWDIWSGASPGTFTATLTFADLLVIPSEVDEDVPSRRSTEAYERQRFLPHVSLAEEPTPSQLSAFGNFGLQGKRVALHSSKGSPFARNLVGLLQACGCDVSLIPISGPFGSELSHAASNNSDMQGAAVRTAVAISAGRPAFVRYSTAIGIENQISTGSGGEAPQTAVLDPVTGVPITLAQPLAASPQHENGGQDHNSADMERETSNETITQNNSADHRRDMEAFSFVMVDDDIETLQRELLRLSTALPVLRGALGQQTPLTERNQNAFAFTANAADSNDGVKGASVNGAMDEGLTHAIVYFTSLKNFRSVRDLVQPIMESAIQALGDKSSESMPEIIIVPKPAGHRRIVTALHSAVHKIVVDPFFAPLATTPMLPHWLEATQMTREQPAATPRSMRPTKTPTSTASPGLTPTDGRPRMPPATATAPPAPPPKSPSRKRPTPTSAHSGGILRLSDLPLPDSASMEMQMTGHGPARKAPSVEQSPHKRRDKSNNLAASSAELPRSQVSSSHSSLPSGQRSSTGNSPMPVEALEYFSETAARMGSTGSSGMVIQSPDGRPAGIFFHPKTSTPGSTRSASGRKGTPSGSISGRIGEHRRRSSDKNHSSPATSPQPLLQSLVGALEQTNLGQDKDKDGGEKVSSKSSANSAASGSRGDDGEMAASATSTSKPNRWNEAAPGTIFSPQVGIESVLQSGKLPLATPISQKQPSFGASGASMEREGDAARSPQQQQPSAMLDVVHGSLGGLTGGDEPEKQRNGRAKSGEARHDGTGDDDEDNNGYGTSPRNSALPDGPNAQDGVFHKPSAQPQPGIMIGAGFASSGKRGALQKKPAKREKVLPPIKVLIVEDNVINQRILEQFMKRKKIQFEVAANGKEAIERWQSHKPHLILMDIQLPVMDGITATKEIRRQEEMDQVGFLPVTPPVSTAGSNNSHQRMEHKTPMGQPTSSPLKASVIIVALTASVLNSDRVAALAAGCNDFLNKPVSLPWLEKKIIEWGSMQYILLSGLGMLGKQRRPKNQSALTAAAQANPDIHKAFGKAPDVKAKMLASKLHLPSKRAASPAAPAAAAMDVESNLQKDAQDAARVILDGVPPETVDSDHRTLPVEEAEKLPAAEVTATDGEQGQGGATEDGKGQSEAPDDDQGQAEASSSGVEPSQT